MSRKSFTRKKATQILLRTKVHCGYCGKSLEDGSFHIDHMTPVSKGGSNEDHNLVATCRRCNLSKGSRTEKEFLWDISDRFLQAVEVAYGRYVEPFESRMPEGQFAKLDDMLSDLTDFMREELDISFYHRDPIPLTKEQREQRFLKACEEEDARCFKEAKRKLKKGIPLDEVDAIYAKMLGGKQ